MSSAAYGAHCLKELENVIVFEDPRTIAAIIMDPLPGSNTGFPLPPEGYLEGVRRLCDKYGILLIFDEIQTGFGKTGKWFFCDHYGVTPDIMTLGKGLTGGYAALGAAVTTPRIADEFRKRPGSELRSGSTFGGHTVACAATLANIAIIERENLVERAAEMGGRLEKQLRAVAQKHAIVSQVRGVGLLWAVLLAADRATGEPLDPELGVGSWIQDWCYQNGMILRNNGEILVLAPSLIVTPEEIDFVAEMIDRALAAAERHFQL
jgi:taurine--2-oxoglutarate transaminase